MKKREMDNLIEHLKYYFNQSINKVFHDSYNDFHVDILLFEPNEKYPFYKLVSMGASSYAMEKTSSLLPNRNEYMLFLSPDINIDSDNFKWYLNFLSYISKYAYYEKANISVGHTIELEPNSHPIFKHSFVLFPQIIEDSWVLKCNLGWFKSCACLQVIPITEDEYQKNISIGPDAFHDIFYPEGGKPIFLADRKVE